MKEQKPFKHHSQWTQEDYEELAIRHGYRSYAHLEEFCDAIERGSNRDIDAMRERAEAEIARKPEGFMRTRPGAFEPRR